MTQSRGLDWPEKQHPCCFKVRSTWFGCSAYIFFNGTCNDMLENGCVFNSNRERKGKIKERNIDKSEEKLQPMKYQIFKEHNMSEVIGKCYIWVDGWLRGAKPGASSSLICTVISKLTCTSGQMFGRFQRMRECNFKFPKYDTQWLRGWSLLRALSSATWRRNVLHHAG